MPGIRDRLSEDMKAAMKEKAAASLSAIRMIRAEILNKDKEHGLETPGEEILKVLQSMVKRREEAAEQYDKGGREDLAQKERGEIVVINGYLPAQLDEEELRRAVDAAIADLGAASVKEMGKVMGVLTKQLAGRATGARISQVVKERLGG